MPDPLRKTISASQAAGLFNVSPYVTPRALYDYFHDGIDIDAKEAPVMRFGKYVQKYILERTAEKFALEVVNNDNDEYTRHKSLPFGCTRDGLIPNCPTRGRGIVEAKSVNWRTFQNEWTDTKPPAHIQIQIQEQMMVEDVNWGIVSCMVGNDEEFKFYEVRPDPKVWTALQEKGSAFMADVKAGRAPAVFGHPIELRGIEHLFPETIPTKVYDNPTDEKAGDLLRRFKWHTDQRLFHKKNVEHLAVLIQDIAKDCGQMNVYGASAKITRTEQPESILRLPHTIRGPLIRALSDLEVIFGESEFKDEEAQVLAAIKSAIDWFTVTKESHFRTNISVKESDDLAPLPEVGGFMI